MSKNYFYFSTHTKSRSIFVWLEASVWFKKLNKKEQETIEHFAKNYKGEDYNYNPIDYCIDFIDDHEAELSRLIKSEGCLLKFSLESYLGFYYQWGASTKSFGKNSKQRAEVITEQKLIDEITNPKGSIKKLLDSAGGDLSVVKPFLPAIMISLDTNTRNKKIMGFKHTGRFCFDFDGLKDSKVAQLWLNRVWKGTKHLKPYMGFISPRGKGFKLFFQVDTSNEEFINDFSVEERSIVMNNHKVWYEGARKEFAEAFPELECELDKSTNDPQRLTYMPYISNPSTNFKYSSKKFSEYSHIVKEEKKLRDQVQKEKIAKNKLEIKQIMIDKGIKSEADAYNIFNRNKNKNFNYELELQKFKKVIEFTLKLSNEDDRVKDFLRENFTSYQTLQKISWVLYGVFGSIAIDEIKKLIPAGSNKLDKNHSDYRWANKSDIQYETEGENSRDKLTPASFYSLIFEIGEVKKFVLDNFPFTSKDINDFNLINKFYNDYKFNFDLEGDNQDNSDLSVFLKQLKKHLDDKKIRLPLIKDLEEMVADVSLGPNDYLDKDVMENLFQVQYADKRVFSLRSQCGTGKSSIATHPEYGLTGKILFAVPYKAITDQMAMENLIKGGREDQLFVNSTIGETVKSFKLTNPKANDINYRQSLKSFDLLLEDYKIINTTYNQLLTKSVNELAQLDYIFIDESHALTNDISFRSDVITALIDHLTEFICKKPDAKTKIIFMSGTPNVETLVIPQIMMEKKIEDLFQRIIVKKEYKNSPIINLVHLDSVDSQKRLDATINQIGNYLKEGRKVCYVFNNIEKMSEMERAIQTKISKEIKVGSFYSDSKGDCTNNILSGKIGEFDVVLVTNYFVNGINITNDRLSTDDIKTGMISTQKYAVVVDLGTKYSKISAMDTIQTINRFRNRLCDCTVFFPRVFVQDKMNLSNKYDFRIASRVLLGTNTFNYHLLSINENLKPNRIEEQKSNIDTTDLGFVDPLRKKGMYASTALIQTLERKEEINKEITNKIDHEARVYEDWYLSFDGYNYLCKDAGFNIVVKHIELGDPLKKMNKDSVAIENTVISNFIKDKNGLSSFYNRIKNRQDVKLKSSRKVLDPSCANIGNFVLEVSNKKLNKYTFKGDFHSSHERALNNLMNCYYRLVYYYQCDKTVERILKSLINSEALSFSPAKRKRHLKSISNYTNACTKLYKRNIPDIEVYIRTLDYLSQFNIGIKKEVQPTFITFTVINSNLVSLLKNKWSEMKYGILKYHLKNDIVKHPFYHDYSYLDENIQQEISLFKTNAENHDSNNNLHNTILVNKKNQKYFNKYFSNEKQIKQNDIEKLEAQIREVCEYTPFSIDKKGKIKSLENIKVTRIIRSKKLVEPHEIENNNTRLPKEYDFQDSKNQFFEIKKEILHKLESILGKAIKYNKPYLEFIASYSINTINNIQIQKLQQYMNDMISCKKIEKHPEVFKSLKAIKKELQKIYDIILTTFKTTEFMTYKKLQDVHNSKLDDDIFYTNIGFDLDSLEKKNPTKQIKIEMKNIYSTLSKHTDSFKNTKTIRPRTSSGTRGVLNDPNYTKKAFIVLDANGKALFADFSKSASFRFLCNYAFKNEGFILKDGTFPVKMKAGIYNPETYRSSYYNKKAANKTVKNYSIIQEDVNINKYLEFLSNMTNM